MAAEDGGNGAWRGGIKGRCFTFITFLLRKFADQKAGRPRRDFVVELMLLIANNKVLNKNLATSFMPLLCPWYYFQQYKCLHYCLMPVQIVLLCKHSIRYHYNINLITFINYKRYQQTTPLNIVLPFNNYSFET